MTQKEFITLIKQKRESLLLSKKEFARQIPISESAYSKIENYQQNLNYFLIKRIAELLEIDLNILKEKAKDMPFFD